MNRFKQSKQPRSLKKTTDAEERRRNRDDQRNQLRIPAREEQVAKKRTLAGASSASDRASHSQETETKLRALPFLQQGIMGKDPKNYLSCVTQLRKLLSIEKNPPIQEVINCGVVPRLAEFLTATQNPPLQFESAWALTNIASGTSSQTRAVIDSGAVKTFVELLRSPSEDVREQAVWALGNIAGDSHLCRDWVLKHGALEPLLALCQPHAKITLLRNATWTLSNLCRGKPQPDFASVYKAIPVLSTLIWSKDEEVLTDACWALSYLSDDSTPQNYKIQAVIHSANVRHIVELLLHKSDNVKTPALRTIGNLVTGDDQQTQAVLNCAVLSCLLSLLVHPRKNIRKEACWTISNITAGSPDQIELVIKANLIPPLITLLHNSEWDIQKEAAWALSNATASGKDHQIRYLVQQGAIGALCDLLNCSDPKIVMVAMEGIENILKVGKRDAQGGDNKYAELVEECNGLDYLDHLQKHDNQEIYEKVIKILKNYFDGQEDEDLTLAPTTTGTHFSFGSKDDLPAGGFTFTNQLKNDFFST